MHRVPPEMTRRARALRNEATPAERALWLRIRAFRPKFTRQLVIGPFIADFACRQARLIIELDGGQHFAAADQDAARTAWLAAHGWTVLRFWNTEVAASPDGCALAVIERATALLAAAHPQPLARRKGG